MSDIGDDTNQDLAYLILGGLVAVGVMRLWSTRVKPWLTDLMPSLKDEGQVQVGSFELATSDVVAGVVIAVVALVIVLTVRSSIRAKKKAKTSSTSADTA